MGIDYSKISNKISGLLGALDPFPPSLTCDGHAPLNIYLEEQMENLSRFDSLPKQKQSLIARNLMEYVDCFSRKTNSLDMPQEPGDALITGGGFYFRPNGPVAIDEKSFSSDWVVETSGVIGRSDGIEIPFGLVKVENAEADVRGTVHYSQFGIVLESNTPMQVDADGATHVVGKVTIQTPYGNFIAQSKEPFKIVVGENDAPKLIVEKYPIAVRSIENPEIRFRINRGEVSLSDTWHYLFTARSEFDLGDALTGDLAKDYQKSASRLQTEADTGLSFGEWDPQRINPKDRGVYAKGQNVVEILDSNRAKITVDRPMTASFINPEYDSFMVNGNGVLTLRQLVFKEAKPITPEELQSKQDAGERDGGYIPKVAKAKINLFGVKGDGTPPPDVIEDKGSLYQLDYGFSEIAFNAEVVDLSLNGPWARSSCIYYPLLPKEEGRGPALRSDPNWGYFLEKEGTLRLKGIWKDSFHPIPLDGVQIIFGREADYSGDGQLAGGSLSIFEPQNEGKYFWVPGYRSDLQQGERNFDLTGYHQGAPAEALVPEQDKQSKITNGDRPQTLFRFLLNDAICKEDWERVNGLAKLSQTKSLIIELAEHYVENWGSSWSCGEPCVLSNREEIQRKSQLFVDLAIYYHKHFGKTFVSNLKDLLNTMMRSPYSRDGTWDKDMILFYPNSDQAAQVMMDMGIPKKMMADALSRMGFCDTAISFTEGDATLEAKVYGQQAKQLEQQNQDNTVALQKQREALERAIAEAKATKQETNTLEGDLLQTLKDMKAFDAALAMAKTPYERAGIYLKMGNLPKALESYEEDGNFMAGIDVLQDAERFEEALDWQMKKINAETQTKDKTREDFIESLRNSYSSAYSIESHNELYHIPPDRQPEARAKICVAVRQKAEALGISPSELLPQCAEEPTGQ